MTLNPMEIEFLTAVLGAIILSIIVTPILMLIINWYTDKQLAKEERFGQS